MFTIRCHPPDLPPGQGLNMGIRNTSNLVEKIDLVSKGVSDDSLLDSYQVECYPDSKAVIKQSLFLEGCSPTLSHISIYSEELFLVQWEER